MTKTNTILDAYNFSEEFNNKMLNRYSKLSGKSLDTALKRECEKRQRELDTKYVSKKIVTIKPEKISKEELDRRYEANKAKINSASKSLSSKARKKIYIENVIAIKDKYCKLTGKTLKEVNSLWKNKKTRSKIVREVTGA